MITGFTLWLNAHYKTKYELTLMGTFVLDLALFHLIAALFA